MKIINESRNNLLKRKEISFMIKHNGNPGFAKVKTATAEHCKAKEELVVVKELQGKFGTDEFLVRSYVYDSEEDKKWAEPRAKPKKEKAK